MKISNYLRSLASLPVAALITTVIGLSPTIAAADCYTDCMRGSGCLDSRSDQNVSYCSGTQARCSTDCRHAAPADSWGAVAYGSANGAFGYSHGWDTEEKAKSVAVTECTKNGTGCEAIVWFSRSCGAVAADGETVGWGRDDSETTARNAAISSCKKTSPKLGLDSCEIKASHCSK